MADPIIGVKYRIQNVDFLTYIEALSQGTTEIGLRPAKESNFQYWQFESVPSHTGSYYVRNVGDNKKYLCYEGGSYMTATTSKSIVKVLREDNSYRLIITNNKSSDNSYFVQSDVWGIQCTPTTKNMLNRQKWQLIVASVSQPVNTLQTGIYRIRNLNGEYVLTFPDEKSVGSTSLFVRSQRGENDTLKTYQRWNVARQESGQYIIQNTGDHSYLGRSVSLIPAAGDKVLKSDKICLWNIQNIGGFAWSIRVPTVEYSVGVADKHLEEDDEMTLVPSDNASSQIWFMEKCIRLDNDVIYAKREVKEGTYFLQSSRDLSIYMKVNSGSWRITSATISPSKFKLAYVDETSAHFTLTYTTNKAPFVSKIVADCGGYIGLNDAGTKFVLLEKDIGDPGYVIYLPDDGYPHKVVSGRTKKDTDENDVFAIENKVEGVALQMWNLVPAM